MSDTTQATAASNYMRYLPAVFSKSGDDFLARYLKIFQKLLTGLSDTTLDGRRGIQELLAGDVIGNLFYSRFSFLFDKSDHDFIPPISGLGDEQRDALLTLFNSFIGVPEPSNPLLGHVAALAAGSSDDLAAFNVWLNEFLDWLASWVDLVLDGSWSLDKKRTVIAQSMALYRLRGTAAGLSMLINLLLDLPMQVSCYSPDISEQVYGPVSVNVLNPQPASIFVMEAAGKPDTFVLQCAARPGMPLVSGYAPWVFQVQVVLPLYLNPMWVPTKAGAQQIQALLPALTTLLDAVKPAATRYQLQVLGGMCLQKHKPKRPKLPPPPQLDTNAFLGTQVPSS